MIIFITAIQILLQILLSLTNTTLCWDGFLMLAGQANGRLRPGTMEPEIGFKLNSTLKVKNVPASQPALVITPNRQMAYTCCCGRKGRKERVENNLI